MTASSEANEPSNAAMAAVVAYLREQRGVDFSGYRPTTLGRRVRQAMTKAEMADLEAYLDHLQANPSSLDALLDALLINVTSFFRDAEMWRDVQTAILPSLLERRPDRPLRVWSAGCASGEEVYTLTMILAELVGRGELRDRVKIYATDIDAAALEVARAATYSWRTVEEIPAPLRTRYLEQVDSDGWRMAADLRHAVVFGRNDIVQDAPISRIDMLSCRNTLMYFTADVQSRILDRLHFALTTGGVLMLGRAETALGRQGLFSPVDGHRRFYRKERLASGEPRRGLDLTGIATTEAVTEVDRLHAEAMREGPAAQVVISRSGRITFVNRRASDTLPVSDRDLGRLVQDTDLSYRPVELRPLLMRVRAEASPASVRGVRWHLPAGREVVMDVEATPLADAAGTLLGTAVTYLDVSANHHMRREVDDVRQRLQASYQDVQSTAEELETTNEELQSTVAELETTNEELQSTNEKLETTNEELRAVNDELYARSAEEHALTNQAEDLNKILDTVMNGLGAGVIVVDPELRVLVWTGTSQELWGLRADEVIGQSLESLDIGLDPVHLANHARAVLPDPMPTPEAGPSPAAADNGQRAPLDQSNLCSSSVDLGFRAPRRSEWLDAVNRRGRPIRVRLTAQPVILHGQLARAILTTEPGAAERPPQSPTLPQGQA